MVWDHNRGLATLRFADKTLKEYCIGIHDKGGRVFDWTSLTLCMWHEKNGKGVEKAHKRGIKQGMRSRADVFVYEPFSQGPVVISHQRTENREPKVTVSLLLDQHVMAVYWLWESGEGQRSFRRYGMEGGLSEDKVRFY